MENKEMFIALLGTVLKMYSREEVEKIDYRRDRDKNMGFADITFIGGAVAHVNISCDSCIAMMNDIYKALI